MPPAGGVHKVFCSSKRYAIIKLDKIPLFKRFLRNFPVALLVSKIADARCSVRVFERYSMMGGNRLSLTLTLFQNGDSPIRLSAITAGGSQAVFFKVNTLGEESFLDDVKDLLEEILEE